MKKHLVMVGCFIGLLTVKAEANNVTDTLIAGESPTQGDILYYDGVSGNTSGTWAQPGSIPGLQGAQGEKGDKGDAGAIDQQTLDTINTNQTNETTSRIDADKLLQGNLNATNNRVNGLENEVHKLGETKAIVGGTVRLMDSQKWELHAFDNYDVNRRHNDSFGLVVGFKLGKSYEEKLINELKETLKAYRMVTDKPFRLKDVR